MIKRIDVYRYYDNLRRGTSEEVEIVLMPEAEALIANRRIVLLKLKVPSTGPVTASHIRYPRVREEKFIYGNRPVMAPTLAYNYRIHFKVNAAEDAPLTPTVLDCLLTYRLIGREQEYPAQQIDLPITISIAEKKAQVVKSQHWLDEGPSNAKKTLFILLAIPLIIPSTIFCAVTGCG